MPSIDYLSGLLSRLGHAGYVLVFVAAMLESAAMLGLLVPGEALVLAAGFFAAHGVFDVDALLVCVALGAAVGDSIGYEMGRRLGRPALVRVGPRLGLGAQRLERVESFFGRWGAFSVLAGRFVGFARAVVPFVAGASRMRYRQFLPYNAAGSLAWAAAVLAVGYFAGSSWQYIEHWIGRGAAIASAVVALAWLLRRQFRRPPALWIELAIVALFVCAFAGIAEDVVTRDPLVQLDVRVLHWFEAHRTSGATALLMLVSQLHAPVPMLAAAGALAVWLWHERDRDWLKVLAWAVPGGMLVNTALKLLFHRARPVVEHPLLALHSYSFPSGHVAAATLFYGVACALVFSRSGNRAIRWGVCGVGAVMVVLVAISRMYLGAHFLSDVLAAFSEAAAWLTLVLAVTRARFADLWRRASLDAVTPR